jgi:hypothetical protein
VAHSRRSLVEQSDSLHAPLLDDLGRLKDLLEREDVEGARALVMELEARWPHSERVRRWAQVLSPPLASRRSKAEGRPLDKERAWLRDHGREHPGQWLAILGDQLLAAAPDLQDLLATLGSSADGEQALLHFQPGSVDESDSNVCG